MRLTIESKVSPFNKPAEPGDKPHLNYSGEAIIILSEKSQLKTRLKNEFKNKQKRTVLL
jgi:hypothetical protein